MAKQGAEFYAGEVRSQTEMYTRAEGDLPLGAVLLHEKIHGAVSRVSLLLDVCCTLHDSAAPRFPAPCLSATGARSAGLQPASGQDGRSPRRGATPLPDRLGQARVLPDERGLARLQRIVNRSSER